MRRRRFLSVLSYRIASMLHECIDHNPYCHDDATLGDVVHFLRRLERTMVDFAGATNDAIAELGLLAQELIAAVKANGTPDPAVQAAADRLEAAVQAAQASDPTPPVTP